ncbi:MAG: coenzyme F420-0:L-glutamate ligase [Actinobacteria bacterium]|nr:coenzyme F420-0:L-glutamate ligase [Alphaproteobacteria bacterium]MBM4438748.1 coenzyme F420-0:L-glutamate ligase [Actinomycetota bacterium]
MTARLELVALPAIPLVRPGDDLGRTIATAAEATALLLRDGDIVVVAQKIVSKAEGRYVDLATVTPTAEARGLAETASKDPRVVQLILDESTAVLRSRPGVIVVIHRLGVVLANAGIDASNVEPAAGSERVLLLPADPDASCRRLRSALRALTGANVAVIINDSVGRAWRQGTIGTALGAAGLPALLDLRGRPDIFGRPLAITQVGLADALAAAASLIQGEADERRPVVVIRGLEARGPEMAAAGLLRPAAEDLFR